MEPTQDINIYEMEELISPKALKKSYRLPQNRIEPWSTVGT